MFAARKTDGAATAAANYIEDVFSTYLYTGTGAAQSINNGIDLSGKGGLVWMKSRSAATDHALYDTARGATFDLVSNSTAAQTTQTTGLTAFNSNGFSIGALAKLNTNAATYASWTFREQAKFFDVVTYTGTGVARTVAHNLGSVPGCIIVKRTDTTGAWQVYHRSLANTQYLVLDTTAGAATGTGRWNSTTPTDTVFSVGTAAEVNASGGTYVAYLFAHDAGGFGAAGTDNVITCGTYLGSNHRSKQVVTLGYEPQCVFIKNITTVNQWVLVDNMRGMAGTGSQAWLAPNSAAAETTTASDQVVAASTGFFFNGTQAPLNESGSTFIYIAIRRGPMKTPTSGTSVFSPVARTGTGVSATVTGVGFPPDYAHIKSRSETAADGRNHVIDRLRGGDRRVFTDATSAESSVVGLLTFEMDGVTLGTAAGVNANTESFINYFIRRAPGFFDVVVVTTNGQASAITSTHNLGVVPEMMIAKKRGPASGTGDWMVYHKDLNGGVTPQNYRIRLNSTGGEGAGSGVWNNTAPTSTQFTIGTDSDVNSGTSGDTTVFYLFATVAGVSKVGSYTGTGTTKQIDCGFAAGARFVLIKRRDATGGDWYVWDTARGIVSGNDPYLLLNTSAAEVTSTDYIDPLNAGFEISSTAPAAINANGGTFIFLAIA